MKLDFSYEGKVVGYFVELDKYPSSAGRYRFMPYRGPGHLKLQQASGEGAVTCTYPAEGGVEVRFSARTGEENGILHIEEML